MSWPSTERPWEPESGAAPPRRTGTLRPMRRPGSRALLCALLVLLALPALEAGAEESVSSRQILAETARTRHVGERVINFWWLPVEYWVAVARELGKSEAQVGQVRSLFRNYLILGALDVEVRGGSAVESLQIAEIVRRLDVAVNAGGSSEVLRQVDPRLAEWAGELAYVLRSSLGPLGKGLRLLPLPNLDAEGNAIMHGVADGQIRAVYKIAGHEPLELYWYAPLTAIKGHKRCPTGQLMEAHWDYCPWTGARVEN